MTVFDLFMVILGLVLVGVSFFVGEKVTSKNQSNIGSGMMALDQDKILAIQSAIEENLAKLSEAAIVKTENNLNKVTNEKIMAISDYSDQILEKIDQNHTEVVFLYNMLNEKENTVKESFSKPVIKESKKVDKEEEKSPKIKNEKKISNHNLEDKLQGINEEEAALLVNATSYKYDDKLLEQEEKQNNNQKIMELYETGMSITDIAKTLDLGKGEVSFVVNLSQHN